MSRHIFAKNTPFLFFFACGETDPRPKKSPHLFFRLRPKKVWHTKNGGRQAASGEKTKLTRKMCASATLHEGSKI